jgi:hypothetical protein
MWGGGRLPRRGGLSRSTAARWAGGPCVQEPPAPRRRAAGRAPPRGPRLGAPASGVHPRTCCIAARARAGSLLGDGAGCGVGRGWAGGGAGGGGGAGPRPGARCAGAGAGAGAGAAPPPPRCRRRGAICCRRGAAGAAGGRAGECPCPRPAPAPPGRGRGRRGALRRVGTRFRRVCRAPPFLRSYAVPNPPESLKSLSLAQSARSGRQPLAGSGSARPRGRQGRGAGEEEITRWPRRDGTPPLGFRARGRGSQAGTVFRAPNSHPLEWAAKPTPSTKAFARRGRPYMPSPAA